MLKIERTTQFKKDYRRECKGRYGASLETDLVTVLQLLANNQQLPAKYCDHALVGDWRSYRDCHIRPDLILIYRRLDAKRLQLVRLGSHSQLCL